MSPGFTAQSRAGSVFVLYYIEIAELTNLLADTVKRFSHQLEAGCDVLTAQRAT